MPFVASMLLICSCSDSDNAGDTISSIPTPALSQSLSDIPDVVSDASEEDEKFYLPTDREVRSWPAHAPRIHYYLNRNQAITFVDGKKVAVEPIPPGLRQQVLVPLTRRRTSGG